MAPKEEKEVVQGAVGTGLGMKDSGSSWQTSCGGLSARLGTVRARGLWSDCEVLVGKQRTPVSAHRLMLAAASPVLAAMLYGPMAIPDQPLCLPYIHVKTFELLLEYMYTDNLTVTTCNTARSVYRAANYLILPHVQEICKTFIMNNLSPESVLTVYEFSELYDDKEIRDECLKLMSSSTTAVLERGLVNVRADTLQRLFSLPSLAIVSELDLFQAAERWVRAQYPALTPKPASPGQNGADVGTSDTKATTLESVGEGEIDEDTGNAKPTKLENNNIIDPDIGDTKPVTTESDGDATCIKDTSKINDAKTLIKNALKEIRFLTLDPEEFAAYDTSTLLSESEMLAISLNLISPKSHMAMPTGFSSSKEVRNKDITFTVTIPISQAEMGEEFLSEVYLIQTLPWQLEVCDNVEEKYLVYLNLCGMEKSRAIVYDVKARVKVVSQSRRVPVLFDASTFSLGISRQLEDYFNFKLDWNYITDPANGYISDGEIALEVAIAIIRTKPSNDNSTVQLK